MFHQFGPYSIESRRNHFQYYDEGIVTTERALKENDKRGIINMLEGISLSEKKQNVSN